jgi:C_GCAxxG_C_C family probable redox protein
MAGFAGGLGVNGEACGALCGALAVMGLRFGRGGEDEKEDRKLWSCTLAVMTGFREEIVKKHGSIRCRDITGIDWLNRGQVTSFYIPDKIFVECTRIIGDTAKLVGEILERQT